METREAIELADGQRKRIAAFRIVSCDVSHCLIYIFMSAPVHHASPPSPSLPPDLLPVPSHIAFHASSSNAGPQGRPNTPA